LFLAFNKAIFVAILSVVAEEPGENSNKPLLLSGAAGLKTNVFALDRRSSGVILSDATGVSFSTSSTFGVLFAEELSKNNRLSSCKVFNKLIGDSRLGMLFVADENSLVLMLGSFRIGFGGRKTASREKF
jgi:hypothetical protein